MSPVLMWLNWTVYGAFAGANSEGSRLPVWLLHPRHGDVHVRSAEEQTTAQHGGHHPGSGWCVCFTKSLQTINSTLMFPKLRNKWAPYRVYTCLTNAQNWSAPIPVLSLSCCLLGNLCRCTGYRPIVDGCRTFCQV